MPYRRLSVPRSKIPFLVKGLLDWMVQEDLTPYLVVNAQSLEGVQVPTCLCPERRDHHVKSERACDSQFWD